MEPNAFKNLYTKDGATVHVSNEKFRVGIIDGMVYLNGVSSAQLLAQAQISGDVVQVGGGAWELALRCAAAYGLPPSRFLADGSVRLGAATYLRAQPDGNLFVGGPTLEEEDLVQLRPDPQFMYDGPGGVRFEPEEQGLRVLPQTQREEGFLLMGFALGWGFCAARHLVMKLVLRV